MASLALFTTVMDSAAPMAAPPFPLLELEDDPLDVEPPAAVAGAEVATALASALDTPSTLATVAMLRPPVALMPTLVGT